MFVDVNFVEITAGKYDSPISGEIRDSSVVVMKKNQMFGKSSHHL